MLEDAISNQVLWVYASKYLTQALIETMIQRFGSEDSILWEEDILPFLTDIQHDNVLRGPRPLSIARFDLSILLTLYLSSRYSSFLRNQALVNPALRVIRRVRNDYSHAGVNGPELQFDSWIDSVEHIIRNSVVPEAFDELLHMCSTYLSSNNAVLTSLDTRLSKDSHLVTVDDDVNDVSARYEICEENNKFLDSLVLNFMSRRTGMHKGQGKIRGWLETFDEVPRGKLSQLPVSHTCLAFNVAHNVDENDIQLVYGYDVDVDLLDLLDDIVVSLYQLLGNEFVNQISVQLRSSMITWRPLEYWVNVVSPLMAIMSPRTLTISISGLSQRSVDTYSFFREVVSLVPPFMRIIIEDDVKISYSLMCNVGSSSSLVRVFADRNLDYLLNVGIERNQFATYQDKFVKLSGNVGSISEFLHKSICFFYESGCDIGRFLLVETLREWIIVVNSLSDLGMVGRLRSLLIARSRGSRVSIEVSNVFFQSGTLQFEGGKIIAANPILDILHDIATV